MMDVGERYIYITKDQEIWLIDEKEALAKWERMEKNLGLINLGKTKYLMLYSRDHTLVYEGEEYLIGEIIICKDQKGLQPLRLYEIMEAIEEFSSRLVEVTLDGRRLQAFWS